MSAHDLVSRSPTLSDVEDLPVLSLGTFIHAIGFQFVTTSTDRLLIVTLGLSAVSMMNLLECWPAIDGRKLRLLDHRLTFAGITCML